MDASYKNYFTTYDIFLGATLVTLGFKIEALDRHNRQKVEFCFKREQGLDEAIQAYWAREIRVEPQLFSANLKSLKNQIYSS